MVLTLGKVGGMSGGGGRGWGGTRSAESKNCWLQFLKYFSTQFDEIWCSDEAIQVKHPDTTFN